jgi:hypothetical protein
MLVYRVEDTNGTGPYQSRLPVANKMSQEHGGSRTHKTPYGDRILNGISPFEYCGFDSLANLKKWFAGFLRELHGAGFVVTVWDCPDYLARTGYNGQTLFYRHEATKIISKSILARS